jgi:hypothetical protein
MIVGFLRIWPVWRSPIREPVIRLGIGAAEAELNHEEHRAFVARFTASRPHITRFEIHASYIDVENKTIGYNGVRQVDCATNARCSSWLMSVGKRGMRLSRTPRRHVMFIRSGRRDRLALVPTLSVLRAGDPERGNDLCPLPLRIGRSHHGVHSACRLLWAR